MSKDLLGKPIEARSIDKTITKKMPKKSVVGLEGVEEYIPSFEGAIPINVPQLVLTKQLQDASILVQAHFNCGIPLLLRGPKGTAKTLLIAKFCEEHEIPFIQFDCSEQAKRYDFIGRFIPIGDTVNFLLGDLGRVIEMANQFGKAAICLEELNALVPNMQKILNQFLDWRKHVYIPETGIVHKLRPGAKLGIFATMNPSNYGGVFELNEDLYSRFIVYDIKYPEKIEEVHILTTLLEDYIDEIKEFIPRFAQLADETRRGAVKNEITYALSTRDVHYLLCAFREYRKVLESNNDENAEEDAMKLTRDVFLSRYDVAEDERQLLETRWKSCIGI